MVPASGAAVQTAFGRVAAAEPVAGIAAVAGIALIAVGSAVDDRAVHTGEVALGAEVVVAEVDRDVRIAAAGPAAGTLDSAAEDIRPVRIVAIAVADRLGLHSAVADTDFDFLGPACSNLARIAGSAAEAADIPGRLPIANVDLAVASAAVIADLLSDSSMALPIERRIVVLPVGLAGIRLLAAHCMRALAAASALRAESRALALAMGLTQWFRSVESSVPGARWQPFQSPVDSARRLASTQRRGFQTALRTDRVQPLASLQTKSPSGRASHNYWQPF